MFINLYFLKKYLWKNKQTIYFKKNLNKFFIKLIKPDHLTVYLIIYNQMGIFHINIIIK